MTGDDLQAFGQTNKQNGGHDFFSANHSVSSGALLKPTVCEHCIDKCQPVFAQVKCICDAMHLGGALVTCTSVKPFQIRQCQTAFCTYSKSQNSPAGKPVGVQQMIASSIFRN